MINAFSILLALCEGNPSVTNWWIPLIKDQWFGALMFLLIFGLHKSLNKESKCRWFEAILPVILCVCTFERVNVRMYSVDKSSVIWCWMIFCICLTGCTYSSPEICTADKHILYVLRKFNFAKEFVLYTFKLFIITTHWYPTKFVCPAHTNVPNANVYNDREKSVVHSLWL